MFKVDDWTSDDMDSLVSKAESGAEKVGVEYTDAEVVTSGINKDDSDDNNVAIVAKVKSYEGDNEGDDIVKEVDGNGSFKAGETIIGDADIVNIFGATVAGSEKVSMVDREEKLSELEDWEIP